MALRILQVACVIGAVTMLTLAYPVSQREPRLSYFGEFSGGKADRLAAAEDVYELGIEEAWNEGIALIEWPERIAALLPPERVEIGLEPGAASSARRATIQVLKDMDFHHWFQLGDQN